MEQLIESVRKYPCLWNTAAIEYRDHELKDAAWAEVMRDTDLSSVKEVKLKWKKLRDSYRDALKRQSELAARAGGGGGEPAAPAKRSYPWKHMGRMHFLQPHMSARKKPPDAEPAPARAPTPAENGHAPAPASDSDSESEEGSERARRRGEQLAVIDRKLDYLCKAHAQGKRPCTRGSPPASPAPTAAAAGDALGVFFSSMCQATRRLPPAAQIRIKKALFGVVIAAEEAMAVRAPGRWARASTSSSEAGERAQPDAKAEP